MKHLILNHTAALLLSILTFAPVGISAQTNEPPISGLARCTTPVARDGKAHERYLLLNERARNAGENAKIIFVGDSITEGWEGNGKAVWERYYAKRGAVNLGIGSDHTQHVLWRLENGNIDGLKPRVAVVLIGVNNTPDEANSPGDILAGVKAVVGTLRKRLPETEILLLGIFPFRESFNNQRGKALQVNQALQKLDGVDHVHFLDIGCVFITPEGKIPKELMRDYLHPSAQGYRLWAAEMEPLLARLLGESPIE